MSNSLYVAYTPVSTLINVQAVRGPKNFLAEDVAVGQQNVSTSGLVVETVNQSVVVMVSFTLEAMLINGDYEPWAKFGAWALQGGTFVLKPMYPISSKAYSCVVADSSGFKITRAGVGRYTANFKFRCLTIGSAPANAAEVMDSFWGLV